MYVLKMDKICRKMLRKRGVYPMITRLLEPNEYYLADLISAVSFEWGMDYKKCKDSAQAMTKDEIHKKLHPEVSKADSAAPLPSDGLPSKHWASFSDDEKNVYSAMIVHPFPTRFGDNLVLAGGIGGVCTLPQYRKMGGVRGCMESALEDMYSNDYLFSTLYPFNSAYYKQFGFEKGMTGETWTIPLTHITKREAGGAIRQLLPGDDLQPLTDVYNKFYESFNLSVVRREFIESLDPAELIRSSQYIYLWENDQGAAEGFMITKKGEGKILDCSLNFANRNGGFFFLTPNAFRGLISFAKNAFSSDYQSIRFSTPSSLDIRPLIDNGTGVEVSMYWNVMVRAVNVEKILSICKCRGAGTIIIKVDDHMISKNADSFKLTFAPNTPNKVERVGQPPDVSMSVSDFSALICGIHQVRSLCWMPDVTVHNPEAPLEAIFYPQNCYCANLF